MVALHQLSATTLGAASASISPTGNQTAPPTTTMKKKRNLPGMPDPDAEVIAMSPKSLLATNRFVCDVCNRGFQRDQNLQLHRRGHNLPWKLRQHISGKEVRKRVYVCPEPTCVHHDPSRALGDLTGIKKHFCRKHGVKKWKCERCPKKYAVQSDWKAHMKTCGTREYRCDCGTLFSRRDNFITHRAFCEALSLERAKSQPLAVKSSEKAVKNEAPRMPTPSSIPPPTSLTPSTNGLSTGFSIPSSELPENQAALLQQPPPGTASSSPTSSGNVSSSFVFAASVFPPLATGHPTPSSKLQLSYSDLLSAMAGSKGTTVKPMTLSRSPTLFLSNDAQSHSPTTHHHHWDFSPNPQPPLSATALLQKAAQMGATSSSSSFHRRLGLAAVSSSSENQGHTSTTTAPSAITTQWSNHVRAAGISLASELGLGVPSHGESNITEIMSSPSSFFESEPTTLDLLGLGISSAGTSTSGLSALFTSMRGGHAAAASLGGVDSGGEDWESPADTKPALP